MRTLFKRIAVLLLQPPAYLALIAAGALRRCYCLALARAELGSAAVPLDNQILGRIAFHGTRRVRFGHNCRIYENVTLETQDEGTITIGDDVVIDRGTIIVAHQEVTIERGAMIAEYCSIRDQDHRYDSAAPIRGSGFRCAPVIIGAGAWIGRGCAVLRGVHIGPRAVVGANSLVKQNIPEGELWAGAPARAIRQAVST